MLQKILPEDSLDNSSESVFMQNGAPAGTRIEGSLSRETDLAEVRIHLGPTFTRSEIFTFLSF